MVYFSKTNSHGSLDYSGLLPNGSGLHLPLVGIQDDKIPNVAHMDMSSDVSKEKLSTTVIVDDGEVNVKDITSVIDQVVLPKDEATIAEFLSKPFRIATVLWTTSDGVGGSIATHNVGSYLTTNTHWANKLEGYGIMRANVHYLVKLNVSPFAQGELLIRFVPNNIDHTESSWLWLHGAGAPIETQTQQPHVYLNCRDTAVEFVVPYVAPTDYWCRRSNAFDWGAFITSPIANLAVGTDIVSADVTYFMYFTEVELSAPMIAQAKGMSIKKKSISRSIPAQEAEQMENGGSISRALRITSKIASSAADIPSLAAVAKPAAWLTDALAGIASYFGYSKPVLNNSQHYISKQFDRYAATSSGAGIEYPLAMRHDNALSITDGLSITEADEMSWSYLKGVEGYLSQHTWAYNTAVGTSLMTRDVCPATLCNTTARPAVNSHVVTTKVGPPLWYFSNVFKFWRGSIIVRIKIIKTQFHSGRLQITWTPSDIITATPTLTTADIALREIVDISLTDEIELVLPWYLPYNYAEMSSISGRLDIQVLNVLRAPSTVSQSVQLLCFYRGGPDLEYAVPNISTVKTVFSAESKLIDSGCVGDTGKCDFDFRPSQTSQGEVFTSLRQLLTRYAQVYPLADLAMHADFYYWPWHSTAVSQTPLTGVLNSGNLGGDIFNMVAPCFNFYRGSMRVKIIRKVDQTIPIIASLAPDQGYAGHAVMGAASAITNLPVVGDYNWLSLSTYPATGISISDTDVNMSAYSVPYQSRYKCGLQMTPAKALDDTVPAFAPVNTLMVHAGLTEDNAINMYRAIGEDFQFSYFIGCPPLFVSTT